jgi:hypothetical protein
MVRAAAGWRLLGQSCVCARRRQLGIGSPFFACRLERAGEVRLSVLGVVTRDRDQSGGAQDKRRRLVLRGIAERCKARFDARFGGIQAAALEIEPGQVGDRPGSRIVEQEHARVFVPRSSCTSTSSPG